ncbi:MAG: radical SAM protein [Candidatus Omnitrophica bacterium]|nr:radical SAM protein [Candidatus Omnitrophota bacterium]
MKDKIVTHSITKRIDLVLGYFCNANCPFCFYKRSVRKRERTKDWSTEEAKKWILYVKKRGIEEIDFMGGEPTIRKDIFELISFAKKIDIKEVSIITNGITLANKQFVEKLTAAGLDDVMFSLHSHRAAIHDKLTGLSGAFEKIILGINNVREIGGLTYRLNFVVNGLNYKNIIDVAELAYSLGVKRLNFLMFSPIVEADTKEQEVNIKYSLAAPYLKRTIDLYKDKFAKINIRYLPFCFLPGYESFITECAQIQYDPFEWDYFIRMRIRSGLFLSTMAWIIGLFLLSDLKRVLTLSIHTLLREAMMRGLIFKNKSKNKCCNKCTFDYICGGLWKQYIKIYGLSELRSITGKKISDPAYFMHEQQ